MNRIKRNIDTNKSRIGDLERVIMEGVLVGFNGSRIKESVDLSIARRQLSDDYTRLKDQFGVAVGIFQAMI